MGVTELKKVELYYHKSVRENVAAAIQRSGACQIIEDTTAGSHADAADRLHECEEHETHIRYLFRALGGYYTDPVPALDRMLGEKQALSLAELTRMAQKTDLKGLASSARKAETTLNELRTETSQLKASMEILSHIKDFPYTLDVLGEGTHTLKGVLGTLAADRLSALKEDLAVYSADTEFFEAARNPKDRIVWVSILYSRTCEQKILELSVKNGISFVDVSPRFTGTVTEEIANLNEKLALCGKRESEILDGLKKMTDDWMATIQMVSDYWRILHDRYRTLAASGTTESTVRTCFWIPAEALPGLQKRVEALDSGVAFSISDPTKEDNPPSLLRNNAFNGPAEALTLLYSAPLYGRRDPRRSWRRSFSFFSGCALETRDTP